ncbi:MAG: hypothetical protein PHP45_00615 [Elusimicrobiales bacterium]|nr:hypothetical protein [Elusimicrobiales bacterium]
MNFVFLSPHFPPNFYRFCVALQKLGVNVLCIGDCGFGELRPELRAAPGWYYPGLCNRVAGFEGGWRDISV